MFFDKIYVYCSQNTIKWNHMIQYYIHTPAFVIVYFLQFHLHQQLKHLNPPAKAGDQNMTLSCAKAVAHAYGNGMVCP